ncbi:hypothetical protein HMPREF9151_00340 [Hoylesella saccharolytica F0055]|uniref:L,D-TPase catalytic domain-containing protein n=2 Tax=Hoylesella TaxID=2974257 RepID=L1NJT8_9BACT|nr:hypothetical protein HMPREF9151_00340 [Hoylesella saccharolytica F0055]
MFFFIVSCHDGKTTTSNSNYGYEDDTIVYQLDTSCIYTEIGCLLRTFDASSIPDRYTLNYYRNRGELVWITPKGLNSSIDKLLNAFKTLDDIGFKSAYFEARQIAEDLQHIRTFGADSGGTRTNKRIAQLEFNLTKAFLRYVCGQHFGFVNPSHIFNRLDIREQDSVRIIFRNLFDIGMGRVSKDFCEMALQKVTNNSLALFLENIHPKNVLYPLFLKELQSKHLSKRKRMKLLCNLERSRWPLNDYPQAHKKYILVNIPSFHLHAIDGNSVLEMRMACGKSDSKTPLLTSRITRMDINPQWIVPRVIVKKELLPHVGDQGYFDKRNFFLCNRKTGKRINADTLTYTMLINPEYFVVQEGGEGNSLGRIIFRFDNNFSIFIHDTSTRSIFGRNNRGVSHGCIRVQHPYDLALFLLGEKSEEWAERIKYSMEANLSQSADDQSSKKKANTPKLVKSLKVTPEVPVFITYYTMYPNQEGNIIEYKDVYGYDKVLYRALEKYLK